MAAEPKVTRLVLLTVAIAAIAAAYAAVDPASSALVPRCTLRAITGLQCPGCGSQRALHALLHGAPAQAWRLNPFLFFAGPLLAALAAAWLFPSRLARLSNTLRSPAALTTIAAITIAWWIIRNLFPNWP